MGFGENLVLWPEYVDIYQFREKKKKYKSITNTKITFYIILIYFFFLG